MAVKGLTALTLADWGKRVDPNGKVDKIIELLGQTNPILQDMPFVEGNLPTGHPTSTSRPHTSASLKILRNRSMMSATTRRISSCFPGVLSSSRKGSTGF